LYIVKGGILLKVVYCKRWHIVKSCIL